MDPKVLQVLQRIEQEDMADREYREKLRSEGKQQPPEEGLVGPSPGFGQASPHYSCLRGVEEHHGGRSGPRLLHRLAGRRR